MKTDDLKPLWNAYKERVGVQASWTEEELLALVQTQTRVASWYRFSQRAWVNACVSFLLLGLTSGC
ncbi:hypothetical protein ACO2Q8_04135 [Larkinella sp. VNQ87]|uniref:hypothetical protein n=1 Tax=Larkinella sp. VNQ87 TaxID=3400921 RepID=UPI003C088450